MSGREWLRNQTKVCLWLTKRHDLDQVFNNPRSPIPVFRPFSRVLSCL
jgi:hypothetical protein